MRAVDLGKSYNRFGASPTPHLQLVDARLKLCVPRDRYSALATVGFTMIPNLPIALTFSIGKFSRIQLIWHPASA
jgi:hypothetical protein